VEKLRNTESISPLPRPKGTEWREEDQNPLKLERGKKKASQKEKKKEADLLLIERDKTTCERCSVRKRVTTPCLN